MRRRAFSRVARREDQKMAATRGEAFSRAARLFTSGVTKIAQKLAEQAFALDTRLLTRSLPALVLGLVLAAGARAKDTGYVFVSHEKTNNIAVIDPKQNYKVIQWIPTSHRP